MPQMQKELAATIVLPLSETGGGHAQVSVTPMVYARYQTLRQRGVLTKEGLLRLATHDGATPLTPENVTQSVLLPGRLIKERLADLDRAALAIQGNMEGFIPVRT